MGERSECDSLCYNKEFAPLTSFDPDGSWIKSRMTAFRGTSITKNNRQGITRGGAFCGTVLKDTKKAGFAKIKESKV